MNTAEDVGLVPILSRGVCSHLVILSRGVDILFMQMTLLNSYIIIIIKIESGMQGRERERTLYQSEDPNPTQPTNGMKKMRK